MLENQQSNALIRSNVASENYAFCTVDLNHGVVKVPVSRINAIKEYIVKDGDIIFFNLMSNLVYHYYVHSLLHQLFFSFAVELDCPNQFLYLNH